MTAALALFDKKIDRVFRVSEACQRIARIKGVGPKTATAIVAAIGDGSEFKNGRHLAVLGVETGEGLSGLMRQCGVDDERRAASGPPMP